MNKKLITLAVAACIGLTAAHAADTALELTLADGSSQTFLLTEKPTITFSGPEMTVATGNASASWSRDDVKSMKFINNPATAVATIEDCPETLGYDGLAAYAPGRRIDLFSTDGKFVASALSSLPVAGLAKGLYIVRAGRQSLKISIK